MAQKEAVVRVTSRDEQESKLCDISSVHVPATPTITTIAPIRLSTAGFHSALRLSHFSSVLSL